MDGKYLLGIDVGTQSVKAAVIRDSGTLEGLVSRTYRLYQEAPGYQQIDTEDMWAALLDCLVRLKTEKNLDLSMIEGIGFSCLCPGLAAFDQNGQVLVDPIIYSDQRSTQEAEEIREKVGEERLFRITANRVMAGAMSGTSMLWIKRHLPEVYARTKYFGHINTLLAVRMTGKFAMDFSNASYTSLFETCGGYGWSEELCAAIGIDMAKLPPLMSSGSVVGGLKEETLISLGIPRGVPVVIGGGDTACASLAAGIIHPGDVCESAGTTDVLTVCVDEPRFDDRFINRCHVADGTWIYQGALSHAGAALRWFRDEFCKDMEDEAKRIGKNVYDLMTDAAWERSTAGAGGVVFLPYMYGERSPVWDTYARGVFFGASLESKREDFIRAVLEGTAYGLRQLTELAEQVTGRHFREFYSMGGGARSRIWSQIKADVTGKDISVLDVNDMAPIGAALLAGMGTGCFRDAYDAASHIEKKVSHVVRSTDRFTEIYDRRFHTYQELYPRLKDLYRSNAGE